MNAAFPTTHGALSHNPSFGHADAIYNVIDSRQSDPQNNVIEALRGMGFTDAGGQLPPLLLRDGCADSALRYGIGLCGFRGRPGARVHRSFRAQGLRRKGGRPDRQADRFCAGGGKRATSRLERRRTTRDRPNIAVGALRYYMLRYTATPSSRSIFRMHSALKARRDRMPNMPWCEQRTFPQRWHRARRSVAPI